MIFLNINNLNVSIDGKKILDNFNININKGEYMNNLKKVGLTALAGSLALTAAHAGEMSVSGSMVATYNKRDTKESTQNPFGMKTNLTFSGSSELDNGMTASMFTTSSDKFAGQFSG